MPVYSNIVSKVNAAHLMEAAELYEARTDSFAQGKAAICKDLASKLIAYKGFASAKQEKYAQDLIKWAHGKKEPAPVVHVDPEAIAKINAMFASAKSKGLLWPKIQLQSPEGEKVVFGLAGPKSKYAGSLMLTDGGPFGDNKWYGYIQGGQLHPSSQMTQGVLATVAGLGDNPEKAAAAYGKMTGHCCFCHKPLTDPKSLHVGYGPICADKFGLKWGYVTVNKKLEQLSPISAVLGSVLPDSLKSVIKSALDVSDPVVGVDLAADSDLTAVVNKFYKEPVEEQQAAPEPVKEELPWEEPKPVKEKKIRNPKSSWFSSK